MLPRQEQQPIAPLRDLEPLTGAWFTAAEPCKKRFGSALQGGGKKDSKAKKQLPLSCLGEGKLQKDSILASLAALATIHVQSCLYSKKSMLNVQRTWQGHGTGSESGQILLMPQIYLEESP